jgi:hypothetical protein
MSMRTGVCLVALLLVLLATARSYAAMALHVTSSGDGVFILDGDNLTGVEAVDITIDYDITVFSNPHVEAQGGSLAHIMTRTAGIITLRVFRADPDMMLQLLLKFKKSGNSPGGINDVTATVTDTDGVSYPIPVDFFYPDGPPEIGASDEDISGRHRLIKREKSVLQRFSEFKGAGGLKELTALFERRAPGEEPKAVTCSGNGRCEILFERLEPEEMAQEPAIVLSDGETPVVISLKLRPEDNSPDIAMMGADLVSLEKIDEESWVVTAVPREGTCEARLLLGLRNELIEFPLVVAPMIGDAHGVSEKDFPVVLNKYLADQAAVHQGKSEQYLDEYVFTANYLANIMNTSR